MGKISLVALVHDFYMKIIITERQSVENVHTKFHPNRSRSVKKFGVEINLHSRVRYDSHRVEFHETCTTDFWYTIPVPNFTKIRETV
jgi:hypothetical protein